MRPPGPGVRPPLTSADPGAGNLGETGVVRLTVATFNLRNGRGLDGRNLWWFRRRNALRVVLGLDADILALQEVRPGQLSWLQRHLADRYEMYAVGRDDGVRRGEHMVVAARRSIGAARAVVPRWFTDTPSVPGRHPGARFNRMALTVTFVVGGCSVDVVCTHLDERPGTAQRDAVMRLTGWHPGTAVLLGDFNCTIDDPVLAPLLACGYVDALAPLPAAGPGIATHHSFRGTIDGTRIDHILVPRSVRVVAGRIVHEHPPGPLPSDHWPVVAVLEFPDPATGDPATPA